MLETNGFRMENIVSRWSREYGFLSFTSDNGLYRTADAPTAQATPASTRARAPRATASATGSRSATSNSYGNNIGWSGTAGNGI